MNKLEQMHLDCISKEYLDSFDEGGHNEMDCEKAASKSAEITEQIAIEFALWLNKTDEIVYIDFTKSDSEVAKDLFQEFLKTKQ